VTNGAAAVFTASASGNPTPTVQWEVSTDGGSSWRQIAGANSSSYSFTADISDNGYEYRAVYTNSAGGAVTAGATLTANGTGFAPVITTQPADETVAMNATASFSATSSGTPAPTVQWQVSATAVPRGTHRRNVDHPLVHRHVAAAPRVPRGVQQLGWNCHVERRTLRRSRSRSSRAIEQLVGLRRNRHGFQHGQRQLDGPDRHLLGADHLLLAMGRDRRRKQ